MLAIFVFAIAYALKGGWLGKIPAWENGRKNLKFGFLMNGKSMAIILLAAFVYIKNPEIKILDRFYEDHSLAVYQRVLDVFVICLVWVVAVHPSMGEEAGSIGRYNKWWGKYKDAYSQEHDNFMFDRSYGIKKALQRGVWMGAIFSIVMGSTSLFVPVLGIGFVAAHFIGQEIYYRIFRKDSWALAEPIIGALIGFCYHVSIGA